VGRSWWQDRTARIQGGVITGFIIGLNQATRKNITLEERLQTAVLYDLPSALSQVGAAQYGPVFASPFLGYEDYRGWQRAGILMVEYATNSYSEVFGNGLVVMWGHMNGMRSSPNMSFADDMALSSTNMLGGNFCYYSCLAWHQFHGRYANVKSAPCKNLWMVCRGGGRLIAGSVRSEKNSALDRVSDGLFNTGLGFMVDRLIGDQILGNLPMEAVTGLFFPPRLGSAVPVAPTQPFVMTDADWERLPLRGVLGFTEDQLR
jgi:hypothetical protein